jgi:copper chaperone CopZ
MRKLISAFAAALLLTTSGVSVAFACDHDKDKDKTSEKNAPAPAHVATATFKVEGMHCDGCADKVKNGLAAAPGIVGVDVDVANKSVRVKYNPDKLDVAKIAKLISDLGYKAAAEA